MPRNHNILASITLRTGCCGPRDLMGMLSSRSYVSTVCNRFRCRLSIDILNVYLSHSICTCSSKVISPCPRILTLTPSRGVYGGSMLQLVMSGKKGQRRDKYSFLDRGERRWELTRTLLTRRRYQEFDIEYYPHQGAISLENCHGG